MLVNTEYHDRLQRRMINLAVDEVRGAGTVVGAPPAPTTMTYREAILGETLLRLVKWVAESAVAGTCPRLQSFKKEVVNGLPLLQHMLNSDWRHPRVGHFCHSPGGSRCCRDNEEVAERVEHVVRVVISGLLLIGMPDPTHTTRCSCATLIRSVLLCLACHSLLQRSWLEEVAPEHREAVNRQAQDHGLEDPGDFKAKRCRRHVNVASFLSQPDLVDILAAVCITINPIERLQL